MTMLKRVADWRIQIFLDDDTAELIKANEIVEDGVVISRTTHSTFVCKASDIISLDTIISEIETAGAVREVPGPAPEAKLEPFEGFPTDDKGPDEPEYEPKRVVRKVDPPKRGDKR